MPTTLVIIDSKNHRIKRFVGKLLTHHAEFVEKMTALEIEQFRVNPESVLEPEAA